MKRLKKHLASLLAAALVIGAVPTPTAQAAAVKLNKSKLTLTVGKTAKLKLKNNKKKVKWSSSKKSVATVSSSGKVRAKKKGTATITAKVGKKKYKCKVTCRAKAPSSTPSTSTSTNTNSTGGIPVSSIIMNPQKLTLTIGESSKLDITISPSNATSKSVKWQSFYPGIATVDKNGVVSAVSTGRAVILVEKDDQYGCAHDYCEVLVVAPKVTPKPLPTMKPPSSFQPILPTPVVTPRPVPTASPTVRPSTSPTPTPDTSVTKAPLSDKSAPTIPETNLIKNYQVKAVKGTEMGNVKVVNVTITGSDLAEHTNSAGTKGHWVGIGIPKGSAYLQGRGNYPAITSLGGQKYESKPLGELNANSVTFYFDVKHAGDDTGYVITKNVNGSAESYIIYQVNFTNVNWKNGTAAPATSASPSGSPSASPSGSPSASPSGSPSASPGTSAKPSPGTPSTPAPATDTTVTKAPLVDRANTAIPESDLIKNYGVSATKEVESDDVKVVDVKITGNDLVEHTNGAGTKGYWVGIGIPKGDQYLQARGTAPKITSLSTLQGYRQDADGEIDANTVSFYFNVLRLGNDTGYVIVKNGKNGNEKYIIYKVDFSAVKWKGEKAPTVPAVTTAPLVDQAAPTKPESSLISDYAAESTLDTAHSTGRMTVVNVKITGKDLVKHQNANGDKGYWIGIGVEQSSENSNKYRFRLGHRTDVQADVAGWFDSEATSTIPASAPTPARDTFYFSLKQSGVTPDSNGNVKAYLAVNNGVNGYVIYNITFNVTLKE